MARESKTIIVVLSGYLYRMRIEKYEELKHLFDEMERLEKEDYFSNATKQAKLAYNEFLLKYINTHTPIQSLAPVFMME